MDGRCFSFSIGWFFASMLIFWGVTCSLWIQMNSRHWYLKGGNISFFLIWTRYVGGCPSIVGILSNLTNACRFQLFSEPWECWILCFFSIFFQTLFWLLKNHLPISLENSLWVGKIPTQTTRHLGPPQLPPPWPSRSSSASDPTLSTGVFQALWHPHGPGTTQSLMGWATHTQPNRGHHQDDITLVFFVGGFLLKLPSFPTVSNILTLLAVDCIHTCQKKKKNIFSNFYVFFFSSKSQ